MSTHISGLYADPCGVNFSHALVTGLKQRLGPDAAPDALARVTLILPSPRMRKRVNEVFSEQGPSLKPKLLLTSDLSALAPGAGLPQATDPLVAQLQLSQTIRHLLQLQQGFAPHNVAFDMALSLHKLLSDMQEDRVPLAAMRDLETAELAHHWQQSLRFIEIIGQYLDPQSPEHPTEHARFEALLKTIKNRWQSAPPKHPIILAGSTGSRGPILRLMELILTLPQGAVVLPGLDRDLPAGIWSRLMAAGQADKPALDTHPQAMLARVAMIADQTPATLPQWSTSRPANPARNRLVSLALRPAPVTNAWRQEGPVLISSLDEAFTGITLIEAASPRDEATAIALCLRASVAQGQTVALICPDRTLTRQVTAALDRWQIKPDDSAGRPLGLSLPGRFLRLVAHARGQEPSLEMLLPLLKHPLTATGGNLRAPHLHLTRALERDVRRGRILTLNAADLAAWGAQTSWVFSDDLKITDWTHWVTRLVDGFGRPVPETNLECHLQDHLALCALLIGGPNSVNIVPLWDNAAGLEAQAMMVALEAASPSGGVMRAREYATLIGVLGQNRPVREQVTAHPLVRFLPTIEARIETVDRIILAGLNEGIWPAQDAPDPWLSRQMRQALGLHSPDREIGLTAHNFQQAIAGPEVFLTRSKRDEEAETVPSRWLSRIVNLTQGLGSEGKTALETIRSRGEVWLRLSQQLDQPKVIRPPEPRPAPAPPTEARPKQLAVTQIETLIRDPYAIYASKILNLYPLPPLHQTPDARLRGVVLHEALETFTRLTADGLPEEAMDLFSQVIVTTLARTVPWPAMRRLWQAKMLNAAPWFLEQEVKRRSNAKPVVLETQGALSLPERDFTLTARADRIDLVDDGTVAIYDYKTGKAPSPDVQTAFNKQLPLEALIVSGGGYQDLGQRQVSHAAYLSFTQTGQEVSVPISPDTLTQQRDGLLKLLMEYSAPNRGYAARRAVADRGFSGDYDHLARYGEWEDTQYAKTIQVGQ